MVFNTTVTEWLKEQSPLTEDELQKLCISMDDFKVLNNLLHNNNWCLLMILEERHKGNVISICLCFFII